MSNTTTFERGSDMLNKLRIIFFALIAGPILFFFVTYLMYQSGSIEPSVDLSEPVMHFAIMGICLSMTLAGYVFYAIQKRKLRPVPSLQQKLQGLFKISIVKFALQEGACLLGIIAFSLSGEAAMQALYLVLFIAMGLGNPTIFTIMNDLKLNKEETTIIRQNLPINS